MYEFLSPPTFRKGENFTFTASEMRECKCSPLFFSIPLFEKENSGSYDNNGTSVFAESGREIVRGTTSQGNMSRGDTSFGSDSSEQQFRELTLKLDASLTTHVAMLYNFNEFRVRRGDSFLHIYYKPGAVCPPPHPR